MSRLVRSQTLPEEMIAVTSATEFDDAGLLALGVGDCVKIDDEFQDAITTEIETENDRPREISFTRSELNSSTVPAGPLPNRPVPLGQGGFCLCIAGRFLKGYLPLIRTWPVERDLSLRRSVWCLWPPPNVYIL